MGLQAPHPGPRGATEGPRPHLDLVVDGEGATGQRSGDDGARAPGGERPVDPEPRPPEIGSLGRGGDHPVEGEPQLAQPAAVEPVDRHDLGLRQERAGHPVGHLQRHQIGLVRIGQAGLGEGDHAGGHAEPIEDPQVLLALRLPPLGRGDDEQAAAHRPHPRQHVLEEADVAGHVDERDLATAGQGADREPEVDGEAALLLLGEAVGIGAGERLHEGRLAMIDVAGGGDDGRLRRSRLLCRLLGRGGRTGPVGRHVVTAGARRSQRRRACRPRGRRCGGRAGCELRAPGR